MEDYSPAAASSCQEGSSPLIATNKRKRLKKVAIVDPKDAPPPSPPSPEPPKIPRGPRRKSYVIDENVASLPTSPEKSRRQKEEDRRNSDDSIPRPRPDHKTRVLLRSLSVYVKGEKGNQGERQRLMAGLRSTDIFAVRWYILAVISLIALLEGCIFNTWGPIAVPAQRLFGWSDGDIARLANWGCIAYILAAFPMSWVMDTKGMRPAVIVGAFLIMAGAGLRCITFFITFSPTYATWFINFGQILNGLSSPLSLGASPVISSLWFAADQRTLATSIASIAAYAGIALSFVIGPKLIPNCFESEDFQNTTCSPSEIAFNFTQDHGNFSSCCADTLPRVKWLLYGEGIFACALFILVVIYFPSKPPLPPSMSSSGSRLEFLQGLKRLLRKRVFWVVAFIYGLTSGVYSSWSAVLNLILGKYHIPQQHAGWIGFYSTVAGAVGGIAIATFADRYAGKLRQILIFLFACSTLMFSWFAVFGQLFNSHYAKLALYSFYTSSVLGGLFINSTIPLFFEMAVESAFPISEGIAAVIIMLSNNIFSIVVLVIIEIPAVGVSWISWCLVASCVISIPVLALLKDEYVRSTLDDALAAPVVATKKPTSILRRANSAAPGRLGSISS